MRIRFHCALMLLIAFPLLYAETIDRIVATVNGHPVMESELTEQLHLEQFFDGKAPRVVSISEQRAALERLLDQMLLQQQMDAANFAKPTPEEISQRLQDLRRQIAPNQGDGAWQGALSSYGLTENDVAEHVAIELRT